MIVFVNGQRRHPMCDGKAERDKALTRVEAASSDWDRRVIDRAIRELARTGRPFSANDVRDLLPEVRRSLVGSRFLTAARRGLIRRVGFEPSTDPGTHAHAVGIWTGTAKGGAP